MNLSCHEFGLQLRIHTVWASVPDVKPNVNLRVKVLRSKGDLGAFHPRCHRVIADRRAA